MADAASIGSSFSSYTGNAALGGGVIDAVKIDTKPIEQLAQYTMLYNKAEYDQRQKDAEKAATEIADATSYDLTSSIPKDAKILQDKYNKLQEYLRDNPEAVNYRNTEKWQEYKRMRNDLEQDITSAKSRSILKLSREQKIAAEKNPELKKIMEDELNKDIERTDIRTPLPHDQQYDLSMPEMPKGDPVTFDVYKKGANQDFRRDYSLFDVAKARQDANVFAMGLDQFSTKPDPMGPQGPVASRKAAALKNNFWVQGAEILNAAIGSHKNADGTVDESKLKGMNKQLVDLVKKTNEYLATKSNEIKSGVYTDAMGKAVTFGTGLLKEEDYAPINWQDGISPEELAVVTAFASWAGDSYKTNPIQTNDELEQKRLDQQRWATIYEQGNANYRAQLSAGGGSTTTGENRNFMDLTNATPGEISIADMAAINPNWVVVEDGVMKLNDEGLRAKPTIQINNTTGDVTYKVTDKPTFGTTATSTTREVTVSKQQYQKNSVATTQTTLKDRKGEEGNPFTYKPPVTAQGPAGNSSTDPDAGLTDAQYFIKYKKQRPK